MRIIGVIMARMTEEEAGALDDFVTNNEIKLGPNGSGWLSQREVRLLGMDDITVKYLKTRAESAHTSIAQVINDLVREKVAVAET
jgi:hypothetical protein